MARNTARVQRSVRKDKSGLVWCCAGIMDPANSIIAPEGQLVFPVVDMANDVNSAAGQAQATFLRMRGWISCFYDDGDPGRMDVLAAAFKIDANEVIQLDVITTYTREDILWTGGVVQTNIAIGGASLGFWHQEIDIRAKRRIRTGEEIQLIVENQGDQNMRVGGVLRGLVRLR